MSDTKVNLVFWVPLPVKQEQPFLSLVLAVLRFQWMPEKGSKLPTSIPVPPEEQHCWQVPGMLPKTPCILKCYITFKSQHIINIKTKKNLLYLYYSYISITASRKIPFFLACPSSFPFFCPCTCLGAAAVAKISPHLSAILKITANCKEIRTAITVEAE